MKDDGAADGVGRSGIQVGGEKAVSVAGDVGPGRVLTSKAGGGIRKEPMKAKILTGQWEITRLA